MRQREIPVEGWRKVVRFDDEATGLAAIIAVHDATLGPACGGCRVRAYPTEAAALDDVLRLSRGMTFKNALGDIPFGGGKAVIMADPARDKTDELMRAFGRAVDAMGGLYYTAEDSGVTEHDLEVIRTQTKYAAGVASKGVGGNPSPFTARGVWRGIEAAARARLGRSDLDGLKVSIQGVGAVGMALAEHLYDAGAHLIVGDVNARAVTEAQDRFGAAVVAPEDCIAVDADVYSPCALGGAINTDSIARLKAPIVAGAANNQLFTPDMDAALMSRGVLYAPDYVINAAGVISVGLEILGKWTAGEMNRRIDAIGPRLDAIFERSRREGRPTGAIADEMALEVIAKGRAAA
jgi:leucine dehydrogenase